jgi:hypothetical protein
MAKSSTKSTKPSKPASAKPAPPAGNADALWAQYCDKPDRELLRVYADALAEAGNPRGTFINLCLLDKPTAEQLAAKETMQAKQKKLLAGPGGEYLREFMFGPLGLVARARGEAGLVAANLDALRTVNPRLVLTITSIKTLKDAVAFGAASLADIWFVDFGWITGTHGGMSLSDKQLKAIAPALAGVKHLQFSCRGGPDKNFTPAGLREVAPQWKALRYLSIDYYSTGLPPAADYTKAIAETLPQLRAFDFSNHSNPEPGSAGLLASGRPSRDTEAAMDRGVELADQLEAVLSRA